MYPEQYINDGSDSDSEDEYSKSYVGLKYNDSRIIQQDSYEQNDYDQDTYYSSVSDEDDYNQHANMLFNEKND